MVACSRLARDRAPAPALYMELADTDPGTDIWDLQKHHSRSIMPYNQILCCFITAIVVFPYLKGGRGEKSEEGM